MKNIEGNWAGRIYGTNTGNVFCNFKLDKDEITGVARINDDSFGLSLFTISGKQNSIIQLRLTQFSAREELTNPIKIEVKLKLQNDGNIIGDWITENGHAGTLALYPHKNVDSKDVSTEPQQIYSKTVKLGSIRLFRKDIEEIINYIKKDFPDSRLIISYYKFGSEVIKFADDFFNEADSLGELKGIKLSIQDTPPNFINRIVNVDLLPRENSEIRIFGSNESWVLGKAESIRNQFLRFTNKLITVIKKYGLTLNSLIFFIMLILIPEINPISKRAIFVGSIVILLSILVLVHRRFIPNTIIFLNDIKPNVWKRIWPSILSWLISLTSTVVGGLIYYFLTK